jgi:hypothetical protein
MRRGKIELAVAIASASLLLGTLVWVGGPGAQANVSPSAGSGYEPTLAPANFVKAVDNPYFPLPVGRMLVYRGIKDGVTQTDRVRVTRDTKVIEGITATAVSDVATHRGKILEKTLDFYAQDKDGNVWYLGENTKELLPNGKVDRSGSWMSGVHDGEPGLIMEAHPRVPDAYRQEYLKGQAEDMAWIVTKGGTGAFAHRAVRHLIKSIEFSPLEPHIIDQKLYAPGLGIVSEIAVSGPKETARLVRVRG